MDVLVTVDGGSVTTSVAVVVLCLTAVWVDVTTVVIVGEVTVAVTVVVVG